MNKYFITSDVHSFYNELMYALNEKGFDNNNPEHKLIICGDVFDRGEHSKDLYKFLKSLGDRFIYIRGNHEDLLKSCVEEISLGKYLANYHFSNGTVKTICQLTGVDLYDWTSYNINAVNKVCTVMQPILEWIDKKAIDYYELNNYIFVHGWVPCDSDDPIIYHANKKMTLIPRENWDKSNWEEARWINGMLAWKQGNIIPNKTIVCGHWHSSFGNSKYHKDGEEFGETSNFKPFIDEGIIAIDGCVAYSGFLNCIVIEEK